METPQTTEVRVTVRFPPDVIEMLRVLARSHQRSLNGEIVWALRTYATRQMRKQAQPPTSQESEDEA